MYLETCGVRVCFVSHLRKLVVFLVHGAVSFLLDGIGHN